MSEGSFREERDKGTVGGATSLSEDVGEGMGGMADFVNLVFLTPG